MSKQKKKKPAKKAPRKQLTVEDALSVGVKQAESLIIMALKDDFGFTQQKLFNLVHKLEVFSNKINTDEDNEFTLKVKKWAIDNDLEIKFSEKGFMTEQTAAASTIKLGIKTHTVIHFMYVLKYSFKFTYADLQRLKSKIVYLQDSVDKKYITYGDIYSDHKSNGIII